MSTKELCITILLVFGIFHIELSIFVMLINNKIDEVQKILKAISNKEYEHFS